MAVNRWTMTDGTSTMTVAFNPFTMGSPHGEKDLVAETAQLQVVMNPKKASEWTFQGNVYNNTEYAKLVEWHEKDMILEVTDHLLRTWQIVSVALDITDRRPSATNNNRYVYNWNVLVLGRVNEEESS
jgi:hypothetical protein